jgi:hypothetical protein
VSRKRALERQALAYERRLTDQRFHEFKRRAQSKYAALDREQGLRDRAAELADKNLELRLSMLDERVELQRSNAMGYMTVDRFEREHRILSDQVIREAQTTVAQEARATGRASVVDRLVPNMPALISMVVALAALVLVILGNGHA